MKRIKVGKLNDIILKNDCSLDSFIGFEVIKNKDINGVEYELKGDEQKYYLFGKLEGNSIFVSEERLLNILLKEYIDEIESGSIYDHGYPESRLIPSDHYETCRESYVEQVLDEISGKVENIFSEYF